MIGLEQAIIGILSGLVLIVSGLVPRLFQELFQGLLDGIRNFRAALSFDSPIPPYVREAIPQQNWLTGLGVALIALTVLVYLWG